MNAITPVLSFGFKPGPAPRPLPQPAVVWAYLAVFGLAVGWLTFGCCAEPPLSLRPPAVPLVAHDPYFSIWSPADQLAGATTTHWTGKPQALRCWLRVDGRVFRLMGTDPAGSEPLTQTRLEVRPTSTTYAFADARIQVTLTFLTPALPADLDVLARPVTYLTWEISAADGQPHAVQLYFDCGAEVAVNLPAQRVVGDRLAVEGLQVLRVGSFDQKVLGKKGDDLRIDWGHAYVAAAASQRPRLFYGTGAAARSQFALNGTLPDRDEPGEPRAVTNGFPVLAVAFDLGRVTGPQTRQIMLAYDDEYSIRYFGSKLRPYWRRNGAGPGELLKAAAADYAALAEQCRAFDAELMAELERVGGREYALLCVLAYRQTLAGNKLAVDAEGKPLLFPKENFSNGCISTVDVLFPQAPFFLGFSPALTKAMLIPVLAYSASARWPYGYAPHDLGTYPHATGQVYGMGGSDGDRMPVEESGNMLIMLAALARVEGNAAFVQEYWPLLAQWAEYLVREGLDPQNQLCSADMFGHLPHCANLALKAIIGIGGYGQLCELAGRSEEAAKYRQIARDYAGRWQKMAADEGRTRLAYHLPGTWGMKHNLIWDRILGLNLIPESVGDAEIAWYLKMQRPYGLPVDNRTDMSLIDWAMWSTTLAREAKDFQALVRPLFRYVNETPSRVPLSDWFVTTDGKQKGFQARPVVGGLFIRMLTDRVVWTKWAGRAGKVSGPWAALQMPPASREVAPSAQTGGAEWRYTFEPPVGDWFQPAFDDSTWKRGPAGFGTRGTPGAVIRTEWKTSDIWIRRAVILPDRTLKNPRLTLHYDEDPEVYLNGVLAAKLTGWTSGYEEVEINPAALAALKPGTNWLAVHTHQTYGGQSIDAGLVEDAEVLPVRRLFDFPVRDTSICTGPDGAYYLTGTTGAPTWWTVNDGIRVWRSVDLTNWIPLGLVWSFEKNATWQRGETNEHGVFYRAIWAPDIHYLKGTFWLTYCVNYGGTGLLRSRSGKAEGPYEDVKTDGPITGQIDASLFQDDDGTVYFVWQNGMIARLNEPMNGLAEAPRLLKPANAAHVGFEGAYLAKINGRYTLICAEFNRRDGASTYDCMVAHADSILGPYGERYLALPHAGHNMFFKDLGGQWWATFFGNDPLAPWRERPGILPIKLEAGARVSPVCP